MEFWQTFSEKLIFNALVESAPLYVAKIGERELERAQDIYFLKRNRREEKLQYKWKWGKSDEIRREEGR